MTIDLSTLAPPDVVQPLDFEEAYAQKLALFKSLYPQWSAALESDMVVKLIQLAAYDEIRAIARTNDAARAVMLAFAGGSDLEHLGALQDVLRGVVSPADDTANPPVPAVLEGDARFRSRIQMAPEKSTVAGPFDAYRAFAMDASARIADVVVDSPTAGTVRLTVMASDGDGVPDADLLAIVNAKVSPEDVRPLNDWVDVVAAGKVDYEIDADVFVPRGVGAEAAFEARKAALDAAIAEARMLGVGMPLSALYGALHPEGSGVRKAVVRKPAESVECNERQFANCTAIRLSKVEV